LTTVEHRLPPDYRARTLRADVLAGLTANPKTLPPKWFYDAQGSALFEKITELPEYYPTRAERSILRAVAPEVAAESGAQVLVELGSGSSEKTRLLLDALRDRGTLRSYVPVDVSESALVAAGDALAAGLSRASLLMAIVCAAGVALAALMVRHRYVKQRAVDRAAAAAATTHTVHAPAMTQT